ncbi:MAG: copper amine oxidase N-terminal domain-containing protein [Clostridia bacterium]|nr:copper amine oxidase N-terminal domain-containing protein [Clostridia bacterium]
MKKWGIKHLIVISLAALILGYGLGKGAGAGSLVPGSSQDPLVSKSYVDNYINGKYSELKNQVEALSSQVEELEKLLEKIPHSPQRVIKLTIGSSTAYIDDKASELEVPPMLRDGYTMLPLRFIGEALGATFDYNDQTKTVTFKKGSRTVILKIGSRTAEVDGKEVTLEAPAVSQSGRTLVPLRFVGEALGAKVDWDGSTKTVTIIS